MSGDPTHWVINRVEGHERVFYRAREARVSDGQIELGRVLGANRASPSEAKKDAFDCELERWPQEIVSRFERIEGFRFGGKS